jgi:hypothetical protein
MAKQREVRVKNEEPIVKDEKKRKREELLFLLSMLCR